MQETAPEIIIDEIALTLQPGLNNPARVHLLEVFGDARGVYSAGRQELLERASLRPDAAAAIASKAYHRQAESEWAYCRKHGITPLGCSSPDYPALLRECCDYPVVIYTVGDTGSLGGDMLAAVGTRKISPYGASVCSKLIGGLAAGDRNITVVSGLAYGVDAAAHRAALDAGITTVAVLGNKLPKIYPADNAGLARRIVESGGCILSEMNSGSHEGRMNFVARNRIIAGMCRATLIVESPLKGGSMITAGMAAGYDRTVMAVPGRITDENSCGTNRLIRELKAVPVTCAGDIWEELGTEGRSVRVEPAAGKIGGSPVNPVDNSLLPEEQAALVELIAGGDGMTVDRLADSTGLAAQKLMADLFELELAGRVRRTPGGTYILI